MTANSWSGRSRFIASPCQLQSHEEDMSRDAQLAGITGFLVRLGLSMSLLRMRGRPVGKTCTLHAPSAAARLPE